MPDGQGTRYKFKLPPRRELRGAPAPVTEAPETPFPEGMQLEPPPDWGEVGEYAPISLQAETGEKIQAWVKPDRTVWRGKDQIGSLDEYDRFVPAPPTVWEQFGEAGKELGMYGVLGLSYLFKPFELFHEYVATPFAMGVTAPWWSGEKLEAFQPLEFMKEWFKPEGKFRKAYKAWEAPRYLKGTLELLPWFALPGFGQIAGAVGRLGMIGRVAAKGLTPYVAMEKAVGKIISVPIKQAGKVVKRVTLVKGYKMANPKPTDEILAETRRLHPNLLGVPRGLGITTKQIEKTRIERQWREANAAADVLKAEYNHLGYNEVQRLSSTVNRYNTAEEAFLLKKMPVEGFPNLPHQAKVTLPGLKPKKKGGSMYLRDILEYPNDYHWPQTVQGRMARLWAEQYQEGVNAVDKLATDNVSKEMRGWISDAPIVGTRSPSRVVAQYDPKTGKELWRVDPFAGGARGGEIAARKPRKFTGRDSQKRAIEAGYEYLDDPVQSLALYGKGVYNMAGFEAQMGILKIPYETPAERLARMNADISNRMKQIEKDIKFLGGGLTRVTTKEGKVIIEKHRGIKQLVNSVQRGEVPTAGMVGAVERRFPELGVGLRDALEIRYLEFDQALKGISEAVFKDTKITRDKFLEMLNTVRTKRGLEPLPTRVTRKVIKKPTLREEMSLDEFSRTLKSVAQETKAEIKATNAWIKRAQLELGAEKPPSRLIGEEIKRVLSLEDRLPTLNAMLKNPQKYYPKLQEEFPNIHKLLLDRGRDLRTIPHKPPIVEAGEVELRERLATTEIMAGELTETLDKLGVEAGKQVRFLSKLYQSVYKQTNVERGGALKSLLRNVKSEISRLKSERSEGLPAFRRARQDALQAAFSEGRILNLPGWVSVIIPKKTEYGITGRQIADELMKRFTPEKVNPIVSKASTLARTGVTLIAALDLSLLFIQGPLALGHDIGQWASFRKSSAFYNMTKGLLKGIQNPKYSDELIAKEGALLARYAPEGLEVRKAVDYLQPEIIENAFRKWGKIGGVFGNIFGQTYGRFGSGFGAGSLAGRVAIIKNAERAFLEAGWTKRQIAEYANKVTGVISSELLGVRATQRALESASLFSPNYTRAYLMVLRDLVRRGLPAGEIRKSMAGMLAGGVLAYVGLCEAIGQEPKLNPAPKSLGGDGAEFMSFKIGNSVIGLPGFWYSAIRMMTAVGAAAEQDPERLLSLDWRENDFLRFWMGRTSPLVAVSRELLEQKDYLGRRLDAPDDWVETMGSHFLTIAAQNLITRDPSEEEGKFKRFGAEIFGVRTFPTGDWRKLEDMENEYAQREFKKPFDDLNREEKDIILDKYPEYKAFSEEARDKMVWESGEDFEHWTLAAEKMADSEYHAIGEQLARALFSGQIDYRTYLDEESTLRKIYQGKAKERQLIESMADPEQAERWLKWAEERPTEDQALDKYWRIRSDLKRLPTGEIDWDATEKRVKEYLDSLTPEQSSYILRMKDRRFRKLPPMMEKIARLQSEGREFVDEYYDQPEGKDRVKYRRANPTTDAWLLLMGRVSVPRTEMAMQLAMEMLQQRGLPLTLVASLAGGAVAGGVAPSPTMATGRRPITMRVRKA